MNKMPTLFKRNFETWLAYDEVTKGCEWVLKGEGRPTMKHDGTACMIKDGWFYKRYDCKKGRKRPIDGIACQPLPDPATGHWPFWVRVESKDKYHWEAFNRGAKSDGTYELCGPKINNNPENYNCHVLVLHGAMIILDCPRTFNGIKEYLKERDIEGIVWHRENGNMCKIKKKDFGMKRKEKNGGIQI